MKIKELRLKTKEELERLLGELENKLRDLRFALTLKQQKNVRELRKTKKTIAQIKTILKA